MQTLTLGLVVLLAASCASKRTVKDVDNSATIAKDYEVKDASSTIRPGWIEDAGVWAEQEKLDATRYRYYAAETEPKVNREIACNLAKANVRAEIAAEITTFIQKTLAASEEGAPAIDPNNPRTQPLREFVSNTLAERVQSLIHGSAVLKTYWEKRNYSAKLGAKRDYVGFTCATLVRMEASRLKEAVDRAADEVVKKASDSDTKENVKKALERIDEDFVKARQGQV